MVHEWASNDFLYAGPIVMLCLILPDIPEGVRWVASQWRTWKGMAHRVNAGSVEFHVKVGVPAPSVHVGVSKRRVRRRIKWWGPMHRTKRNGK